MNLESVLKKSAFGGYTKESVFDLVEMLQRENVKLENDIKEAQKEKEDEAKKYKALLSEKEGIIEELNEKNSSLLEANASCSLKLEEAEANKEDYEKKLNELKGKINAIEQRFDELQKKYGTLDDYERSKEQAQAVISSVKEAVKGAIDKISSSSDSLRSSCNAFSEASEKVVSYADELIHSISAVYDDLALGESDNKTKAETADENL